MRKKNKQFFCSKKSYFFQDFWSTSYFFFIFWAPEALGPLPNCRSHFCGSNRVIERLNPPRYLIRDKTMSKMYRNKNMQNLDTTSWLVVCKPRNSCLDFAYFLRYILDIVLSRMRYLGGLRSSRWHGFERENEIYNLDWSWSLRSWRNNENIGNA